MHTPGPWNYHVEWQQNPGFMGMTEGSIYRKTGKFLYGVELSDTIMFLPHHRDKEKHERAIADARLIASAPELLAALEAAMELGAYRGDRMPMKAVKPIFDAMKTAVAKAKGE